MLELKKVTKIYTTEGFTQKALDDVSIKFRENEFVSILGPSGSGKTTLLNIVGGLDQYTSGDLIINGKSTKKYKDRDWDVYRNRSIGFVFQNYNLIPHQTVLRNVELALTLSGVAKEERIKKAKEVLKEVGLEKHMYKRPNQLSGGQMQRVAIARALINNPDILLADEPTGALDSKTSIQIMKLLKDIAKDKLVIMVTHNPDIANKYSTRIVSLSDGVITDDTNPYDGKEKKKEETNKYRTHMSFLTALSLSLNNLMTKKGRTILTAFAGSIGIIGIALILSLSNGIDLYIDRVEKETLASYPLTLTEETVDTATMITALMGENEDKDHELDKIYSNSILTDMINSLNSSVEKNNLNKFKKYIEEHQEEFDKYTTAISYGYEISPQIYRSNTDKIVQVNPSQVMNKMGLGNMMDMATGLSFTGASSNQYDVFSEIIDDDDLNKKSYDVIVGRWPKNYNEVILFVNDYNEISDFTLYALGILDQDEIEGNMKKILAGEEVEKKDVELSYDDILNLDFTLVLNTSYYEYNDMTKLWVDKREDNDYLKNLIANGEKIKIVGIARPTEESVNSNQMGTIGYLPSLITHIIEGNNDSEVVKAQIDSKDKNIFTGLDFNSDNKFNMENLKPEEQAYLASLSPEELAKMIELYNENIGITYEENIKKIGGFDFDSPQTINIYPVDFDSKENIQELIDKYNEDQKEEDVIHYTDVVGVMMKSVTNIVNTISYVLVAFVSISLIVSSIMIGIITYISVLERTKEIGILRAIGASKKDISCVFNAETFIEGTIAGIIGILVTILLNIPINIIIKNITGISGIAALPVVGAIILIIISMILTLIAGLIPSRMASKKDPVEALRTE